MPSVLALERLKYKLGESAWDLTRRYWYHFSSLIAIVVFMVIGFSPIWAVFWATVLAFASSFLRRDTALYFNKTVKALSSGSISVLSVASTCASAGIIVGVVTLTGLGLKFSIASSSLTLEVISFLRLFTLEYSCG